MSKVSKYWAGNLHGTNTGKIYLECEDTNGELQGILRLRDDLFGLIIYQISGDFTTNNLEIIGSPENNNIIIGKLKITGILDIQGNIRGKWEADSGAAGTLLLFPHEISSNQFKLNIPEQVYNKNIGLGAIRLFHDDLNKLFEYIKTDFISGRIIVTYNSGGSDITRYGDDFLINAEKIDKLDYLKINIQEHEINGINKAIMIELSSHGLNEIRVQGVQESWVVGTATRLATVLKKYESTLITSYKKFGLNLNEVILFFMITVIPSIESLQYRSLFTLCVLILMRFLFYLHQNFIPNTLIAMMTVKPTWLSRSWPSLISWIGGMFATVISSLVYYWLTKT